MLNPKMFFDKNLPTPAVFAVGNEYQIMVPVKYRSLMWVEVGDKCYYDDSNGILRSLDKIHRMSVPAEELNKAGKYTICERRIIKRKPYSPLIQPVAKKEFKFYPVKSGNVRAYHIADTHNMVDTPVQAAKAFGKIDFLILNGDIPNHSGKPKYFNTIYDICAQITNGNIPVVFARGNHDLRGLYAEKIADYTPNLNGNTYFTFRLGDIWGIVLDCGEDKPDDNKEYGGTICCHSFREKETHFIEDVIKHADEEYLAEGVKHRTVICHFPFTKRYEMPFGIEEELYTLWAKLLKENVEPHVMICGHTHDIDVSEIGSPIDNRGQPCVMLTCSEKSKQSEDFAGVGFEFSNSGIEVYKTDSKGKSEKIYTIKQ